MKLETVRVGNIGDTIPVQMGMGRANSRSLPPIKIIRNKNVTLMSPRVFLIKRTCIVPTFCL